MALAVDASSPAMVWSTGLATTTASFTPPAGSYLVAVATCNSHTGSGVTFTLTNTGAGGPLSWTEFVRRDNSESPTLDYGSAQISVAAVIASAASTVTLTISGAGAQNTTGLSIYVVTSSVGVVSLLAGGTAEGSSTTNNLTTTGFTIAQAATLGFAAGAEWNALGAPTSSDMSGVHAQTNGTQLSWIHGYKTLGAAGGSATFNLDAGGTGTAQWNWASAEVKEIVRQPSRRYSQARQRAALR